MTKGNLTIRIEPALKKEASDLFQSLGLDLSTATGMFYIQALRCHGLPFPVIADGEPKQETYMAIKDAENDKHMSGPYDSVDDLMEALDALHHNSKRTTKLR